MSKKLIAVASAAALALSALVAMPATAALGDVTPDPTTGDDVSTAGVSAATAWTVDVPETNEPADSASMAILIEVEPAVASGTITAISTGSVKMLTTDQFTATSGDAATVADGTQTFSEKAVGAGAVEIYVFNTSTTAGTIKITVGDSVVTRWIKGVAGTPNTVSAKFPTSLNSSVASKIDVTVTDVFGNAVTGSANDEFGNQVAVGSTLATNTVGAAFVVGNDEYTWSTTRKVWVGEVIGAAGGGQSSITVTLDNGGFDGDDYGLTAATLVAFNTVNAADLATQVTNLTAQVAALQAQMADMRTKALSVTKKKYNKLARKWNAANPSARVALKK